MQQIVKNACDQLNAEGVDARNYVEQLAWLFFLKAFDEAESRKEQEAASTTRPTSAASAASTHGAIGRRTPTTPTRCWNSSMGSCGSSSPVPDPSKGLGNDPLAQRFRRIFDNVRNYSRRGVGFAKVVQQVDKLHFSSETDVIVLSEIYEDLLKRVAADSAGYAGEFYTQRHIIRAMVQVVQPQAWRACLRPLLRNGRFPGRGR